MAGFGKVGREVTGRYRDRVVHKIEAISTSFSHSISQCQGSPALPLTPGLSDRANEEDWSVSCGS